MANVYNKPVVIIGGGSSAPVDNGPIYEGKYRVRYIDADGTILKIEYVESGGRTTPPTAPSYDHDYLIFAEWNYDTDNYIVEQPTDIGATYNTVGDVTYMFCRFTTNTGLNPTLKITGATSVDWGDGTVNTNVSHTYANEGEYIIKIYGDITANTTSAIYLLGSFDLNKSLQKCYIKNGITRIIDYTFYNCVSLTNISIPKSITSIGNYAFSSCTSLGAISIPNSVTRIYDFAFNYCRSLGAISIPNSVTNISGSTFQECTGLTNISIPKSITNIGSYAFDGCRILKSIWISKTITNIGSYAFDKCTAVIDYFIDYDRVLALSYSNAFNNMNKSAVMWVNDSIIEQLKVTTNWSTYASYMKPLSWYPSLTNPNA